MIKQDDSFYVKACLVSNSPFITECKLGKSVHTDMTFDLKSVFYMCLSVPSVKGASAKTVTSRVVGSLSVESKKLAVQLLTLCNVQYRQMTTCIINQPSQTNLDWGQCVFHVCREMTNYSVLLLEHNEIYNQKLRIWHNVDTGLLWTGVNNVK